MSEQINCQIHAVSVDSNGYFRRGGVDIDRLGLGVLVGQLLLVNTEGYGQRVSDSEIDGGI